MPELPEVETMVRGIRPHVEGRRIARVGRCRCAYRPISIEPSPRNFSARVRGCTIESVTRRAKRVVLVLSSGDRFVIEPRMTGLMLLSDAPDRTHLRFEWQFDDGTSLWFWDRRGLGTLRYFSAEEYEREIETKLGPDALDMTPGLWRERMMKTKRPIKVAMLDQKLVAGIGNLYASEILHVAKIHPGYPTDQLTSPQLKRLATATLRVLDTAIRYEGSTLSDGTYRNALNQNGSYQNEHRVYGRAAEQCPTCRKASVTRIVQAQRSTFYCEVCQAK
ncbi:bifunctional DNA-formamidopyrimidine glycosylase/DNA-(apurinic or apyrimidinic site) lyase [Calycomorphotria hydatis]|uniref:Formamidopyrimidine-DNA glycosylase n=1 Tax=Calycomorphotria hydatis TaxID=2528027 RepID=A0A517T464_9PLAN|nr:bifunctional DNA-formamidopyrimidine glycosylase/DNA-(apurinic or apyrimidinic site) lyase [Calycomorphotria hydatis]QDT63158.1 Formamidopyrimidine-DNA glycosylase [Calycomorphotria hydatis]